MTRPSPPSLTSAERALPNRLAPVSRYSTVDLIAERIREAIVQGDLPPGSPLGEAEMAEQLGVSRGPLREGMQRLVQEGLLTTVRRRGLGVASMSAADVADVYQMRAAVERSACLRLLRLGAPALAATVRALTGEVRKMSRAAKKGAARQLGDADLAFHRMLVDSAGSHRLSRSMRTLLIETRLSTFSMQHGPSAGFVVRADLAEDHEAIVDALRDRDETRLLALIESHMEGAVRRLTGQSVLGPDIETLQAPVPDEPRELDPLELPEGVV
ncbi:GntR family transcriptional regulator [Phytomonospora endophytica]|uniref:DNA-binding GntR family transcriptional regulator n=1 Tax=Phytomonospora endophytica TaxID=714109 RepID=A0A841FKG2_9ACTN|nr:GntR family transcriptional regulator [Phytomonospora endophytica]MBB6033129.1 DNA-binding GntR family transcriptional regulator [Phytomonospora endophytica]GIG65355.1 GntR family transcriptional regulator [Phytomonospora endophytica]